MLTTIDLNRMMKKDKNFYGVFPINRLPLIMLPKPFKIIVNLDESWKPGSHWVAVYSQQNGPTIYFDSFGRYPLPEIETFIERNSPNGWYHTKEKLQGDLSTLCGFYCVKFLNHCPDVTLFLNKFKDCAISNDYNLMKKLKNKSK